MSSKTHRFRRTPCFVGSLVVVAASVVGAASAEPAAERAVRVFPRVSLFAPLAADPRWPKFTLGYAHYFGDSQFSHVGTAEAGASIAIVQRDARRRGSWEVGFQGGIFSIFDFGAPSSDLLNADYLGGLTFSYSLDALVFFARVFHQSSHLGDEFLLNNEVDRINLSFEALDVLVSYDLRPWARVYGGSAVIVRSEPSNLDRWSLQAGAELRPVSFKTKIRVELFMAVNLESWQQNDWIPDASFIAGVTLDPIGESSYRVDFLLRYYVGRSPNGQFFTERIQTLGPAVQLYF
jgi:hypothetical protein